jgi:hypothetical protein
MIVFSNTRNRTARSISSTKRFIMAVPIRVNWSYSKTNRQSMFYFNSIQKTSGINLWRIEYSSCLWGGPGFARGRNTCSTVC